MNISRCKTNHLINPLGFDMEKAVFSWVTESNLSTKQKMAKITVALDAEMTHVIYESEASNEIRNTGFAFPLELVPCTEYYWTVQVWGDQGDTAVSEVNYFETGKMKGELQGAWITTPWDNKKMSPYVRKHVKTEKEIKKARLYITGLGMYWLEINGKKIGTDFFAPGCTGVDHLVQVYTYDLTEAFSVGDNIIGLMMGNGWAKERFGASSKQHLSALIDEYYLKAELELTYIDDSKEVILTDDSWKCYPSPVIEDSIYRGEVYDENKAITNWSTIDLDDSAWDSMVITTPTVLGELTDRLSLPIVIKEYVKPISVIYSPKGETIIDMGQNMTGWVRMTVDEPAGTQIKLSHGEILQDGCFYNENLRKAKAEYIYISNGTKQTVEPHFTFYGFRYVKVEGLTKGIDLSQFIGCVVYSDLEHTGYVKTSDARINQLISNAMWSQKDNFLDVPTDCPQRDERMGWTGDAQMFCKTASYNMDTYAFYKKYLRDLWVEQKKHDGMVGHVVPSFIKDPNPSSSFWWGSCAWGDASVIIPWTMYEQYGDKSILEKQYESMTAWIDWVVKTNLGPTGLWENGFKFGDWLALDGRPDQEDDRYGGTDTTLVASGYLKYSSELVAKTAKLLGKEEDAIYYQKISDRTKKAIQDAYYTEDGKSLNNTQTAHVIALAMDLVEPHLKGKIAEGLVKLLQENDMHLTTGFVGTPFLCTALSGEGYSEEAYQVLFQKDFPSWLYEVDMGATTIWERWNSVLPDGKISGTGMNSLNHYTYGSIVQWMYENMCGVTLRDVAFQKFAVNPEYNHRFTFAEMEYDSAYGKIAVKWEKKEDGYGLYVKVPFDTEALVTLPNGEVKTVCAGEYQF